MSCRVKDEKGRQGGRGGDETGELVPASHGFATFECRGWSWSPNSVPGNAFWMLASLQGRIHVRPQEMGE